MTETHTGLNVNAGAFAVAPELAASAFQQISQLQDVVGEMVREAKVLGRAVPLGGGYAEEIGAFMAQYGISGPGSATDSLTQFGQELEKLKGNIAKALKRYSDTDDAASEGVDCNGG